MAFPALNELAPNFALYNQKGELVELKSFRGKSNVVVYFYPKASTPGCTTQACGVRDYKMQFDAINTVVLAISPDALTKLKKFDDKYSLAFSLLSDENHAIAEAYGVWGLKKFMGREYMGILRTSFLIDHLGKLRHIMDKVNTKTHHEDLIEYIKGNF